jgi:hypothetical protein
LFSLGGGFLIPFLDEPVGQGKALSIWYFITSNPKECDKIKKSYVKTG